MAKRGPDLVDPRLAKALEHPLRIEILSILRHGPSSPARIERQLEHVSLNLVSHHIKVLKELGCVELAETVDKGGSREHVYRAVGPSFVNDEEWEELTPKVRHRVTVSILRAIANDLAESLGTGRFDEIPGHHHLTRTPLNLDYEGWSETQDILTRALEEVIEVGHRSSKRLRESEEPGTPATIAIMQFPTGA